MTFEALQAEADALVDEPYGEPWQARVVALAVEAVGGLGVEWDEFRQRLKGAIGDDPRRPYFDSWLIALEGFTSEVGGSSPDEIDTHRMRAASYRTTEVTLDDLEVFPIVVGEQVLLAILTEIFERWWQHVRFGTVIDGAVYELTAPHRPRLSMLDGYLTIAFDRWHIRLCIGEHRGSPGHAVAPELAARRRCAHAELQRLWIDGAPRSWMFRMFNGDGAQQITVLLPNPFLDDDDHMIDEPDWTRLELWDLLRRDHLGLPSDPIDRSGSRFVHG